MTGTTWSARPVTPANANGTLTLDVTHVLYRMPGGADTFALLVGGSESLFGATTIGNLAQSRCH